MQPFLHPVWLSTYPVTPVWHEPRTTIPPTNSYGVLAKLGRVA